MVFIVNAQYSPCISCPLLIGEKLDKFTKLFHDRKQKIQLKLKGHKYCVILSWVFEETVGC